MDRDYDRARSGGRFGDDYGQFSRSAERDHSMSGARRAYVGEDMDRGEDMGRDRDDYGNRDMYQTRDRGWDRNMGQDRGWDRDQRRFGGGDWDASRRDYRGDYTEQVYRADWDDDRVQYRDDTDTRGRRMVGDRDRDRSSYAQDRYAGQGRYDRDMGARGIGTGGMRDRDRDRYGADDDRYANRGNWREQRAYANMSRTGYGSDAFSPDRDRAYYQYGRGEPTFGRDLDGDRGAYDRRDMSGAMSDWRGQDWQARSDYYTTGGRSDRDYGASRGSETWALRGPHTGRGPQGYQRADERIREDACERLTQHGDIDASDINLMVANGEITLEGTVDSRRAKRAAEDAVEDISGVREVHNRLRVRDRQGMTGNMGSYDRMQSTTTTGAWATGVTGATAMSAASRGQVAMGMDVVGSEMNSVGTVKETRGDTFLIDRPLQRDIWAPFSAIRSVSGTQVVLNCAANEVDDQGWENPPMMGGDADQTAATTPTT